MKNQNPILHTPEGVRDIYGSEFVQKFELQQLLYRVLAGQGAWRLQGGGFAGTIQAFVPHGLLGQYQSVLEGVFGQGACYVLNIRNYGGIQVQEHL